MLNQNDIDAHRRSALAFLMDVADIDQDEIDVVLGEEPGRFRRMLEGHTHLDGDPARTADRIIATHSLLLSGYSPEGVATWYSKPIASLSGMTPRDATRRGPDGVRQVLLAAYDRIAS